MTINDTAMPRARRPETLSSRPAAPGESGTRRSNNLNPTAPGFAPRSPPELLLPELLPLRRKLLRRKLLEARRPSPDRRNRTATPTVPATLRELPRPGRRKQAADHAPALAPDARRLSSPAPPRPPQSDSVSLAARRTASTASAA